jgi:Ni/Co efflux regulator RcnB
VQIGLAAEKWNHYPSVALNHVMNNPANEGLHKMPQTTVKTCKKCRLEKHVSDFGKNKSWKGLPKANCKKCCAEIQREYNKKNSEKISEKKKLKKDAISAYNKENYLKNKDENRERAKKYYWENREKMSAYYEKNSARYKEWRKNNLPRKNAQHSLKKETDFLYAVTVRIRSLVQSAIKRRGYTKKSRTFEILGCDYEAFAKHIESQFKDGMSWDNRSEWHIDHIIPIASAKTESEVLALNHYTNLQPLWAVDNLKKGKKINYEI